MASNLAISGLASGFDWQSLVSKLVDVERTPEKQLQAQQSTLQQQNTALGSIKTELNVLQNKVEVLQDPSFFDTRTVTTSDAALASATADTGTAVGSYSFEVEQLASAAVLKSGQNVAASLSLSDDVSGLTLEAAQFATPVTAGVFTVNGKRVTISATDSLQSVLDQIGSATGGAVTASYSAATDTITLTGTGRIVLGSATDTSNFLQAAKLSNNGTNTITSSAHLGGIRLTTALSDASFATPITDGGAGAFSVNGVEISFAATDTLAQVIGRINASAAGVTAAYDAANDRMVLTNKQTGDMGIALEDKTGNFLAAVGLLNGSLTSGTDLHYTVNGGDPLSSQTNTITEATSGVAGLSVAVAGKGTFSVTVASDTKTIRTAITDFVTQYNKVQALINSQTASSTDAKGKVTAGLLAGDQFVEGLVSQLRGLVTADISGLTGMLHRLESLGISSNGHDDSLSTSDLSHLDDALASDLQGLKDLFTHSSTGLAVRLDKYLDATIGDDGSLVSRQTSLTNQSKDIDTQVSNMERQVLEYEQQLTSSFIAMETAQAKINQQLQYLQNSLFSNGLSSSKPSGG